MPWTRSGDTSATYPPVMRVAGMAGADDRSINEVHGFFRRLADLSSAHMTDYVVDQGTVDMIGGRNAPQLVRFCIRAGLLTRTRVDGMACYVLLDDPEFIHIRLKAEVMHERQQRNDTRDDRLTVPVRQRDGDLCRYCGIVVQWRGRTSTRKATFDHVEPDNPGTVATMVVACRGCNSELRAAAGLERDTPRPEPIDPFYTPFTAAWLTEHGRPTAATPVPDA